MKKILLTLAAVAMSAAMMAAPIVETYDFTSIVSGSSIEEATIGTSYVITSPANMGLISFNTNTFGNRFAGNRDLGFRNTGVYKGLTTKEGYSSRYIAILNLNAGDKVTIKWIADEGQGLKFNNAILEGVSAEDAVVSEQEYTVATAGNVILDETVNTKNLRVYIYSVKIELAEAYYTGAIPSATYTAGYNWSAMGVTFTLGGESDWTRANYTATWGNFDAVFTQTCQYPSGAETPITVTTTYSGILNVYGQFQRDVVLTDESGAEQHSGWLSSAAWTKVAFAVEAGKTYTLKNTSGNPRWCGFTFKPTTSLNISELAVGGGLTLEEGKEYTYDKEAANIAGVRVKLNRAFYNNNVYTICLPFDVPYAKFETYFGSGVKVYDITGYGDDYIQFDELTTGQMNNGYAYILDFREASDNKSDGIKFYNHSGTGDEVTIDQADVNVKTFNDNKIFRGTFNPKTINASNYILNMIDGEPVIVPAGDDHKNVNSFRGYFDVPAVSGGAGAPRRIILGTNAATGIDEIDGIPVLNIDAPMYNVMGQQVDKTYKGVVIQNGHKFMLH